jgi:hypothetical protein
VASWQIKKRTGAKYRKGNAKNESDNINAGFSFLLMHNINFPNLRGG